MPETVIKDGIKYKLKKTYAGIINYTKDIPECVVIPSEIKGLPVTCIHASAFAYCKTITNVIIPNSVAKINNLAFDGCTALKNITIPNSVVTIGDRIFNECTSLTSIKIPKSVDIIGYDVFNGCSSLTKIKVDEENSNYCDINGVLCTKDKKVLIRYPINHKNKFYTMSEDIEIIGDFAFFECVSLESINFSYNVKSIGCYAFKNCKSLEYVDMPSNIEYIKIEAFANCTSLKTISVEDSTLAFEEFAVTKFGDRVFENCFNLQTVFLPNLCGITFEKSDFPPIDNPPEIKFNGTREDFEYMFDFDIFEEHIIKNKDGYTLTTTVHCTDGDLMC